MQRLTILGATGSIGQSTLAVLDGHPDRYQVFALTAFSRIDELVELCTRYQPRYAVGADICDISRSQSFLTTSSN